MDCSDIADKDIRYVIGYFLQDSDINPRYFPLVFKDFVELPDSSRCPPNQPYYEIKDDSGVVVWRWKNDKPLVKPIDVLRKNN